MFKKAMLVFVPVLAALSPMAFFSAPGWWSKMTASVSGATSAENVDEPAGLVPWTSPDGTDLPTLGDAQGPLEGAPVQELEEVLRFDLTPDWVVRRWPRVSAGLSYLELQGYRVPLVTGTAEDDLAGALTYYFTPRQQLQRITFHGATGNARKLVDLVTSRFGFARRLTNDASVFLYQIPGQDGRAASFLWIRPARVVKADEPNQRFQVALVVERPIKR
ncbi:MAG: hypothetical protein A2V98_20510 [Planctomycetes bacterium RBG_16_64_12]|nr:MAG: hypothetical protein A2V98_20510 [Planctomycetes bacterium RBG_16_64_12]